MNIDITEHDEARAVNASLRRVTTSGDIDIIMRAVPIEAPVAIEVNGLAYAVLMATPADLPDLATGFALGERLIDRASDIVDLDCHAHPDGTIVRLTVTPSVAGRILDRVRHRTSDSACGLCGVESLEQTMRPLPRITAPFVGDPAVIFPALEMIERHQPLNAASGAVHAAALCSRDGSIRVVREDVGRHNALDKLIGAMARSDMTWDDGFALITSRCSYELVEKAALADCPMLVTISAPTSLALTRAAEAGLPLVSLARRDSLLCLR